MRRSYARLLHARRNLAFLMLAALATAGCGREESDAPPAHLPPFSLSSLDGPLVTSESLKGQALLINVWATWCEPCRREMAGLQRLSERYPEARLRVVGITVDEDLNLAREFLLENGIRFMNLADSDQRYVRDALHIRAFPHTVIVRADGTVLESVSGAREWDKEGAPGLIKLLAKRN